MNFTEPHGPAVSRWGFILKPPEKLVKMQNSSQIRISVGGTLESVCIDIPSGHDHGAITPGRARVGPRVVLGLQSTFPCTKLI